MLYSDISISNGWCNSNLLIANVQTKRINIINYGFHIFLYIISVYLIYRVNRLFKLLVFKVDDFQAFYNKFNKLRLVPIYIMFYNVFYFFSRLFYLLNKEFIIIETAYMIFKLLLGVFLFFILIISNPIKYIVKDISKDLYYRLRLCLNKNNNYYKDNILISNYSKLIDEYYIYNNDLTLKIAVKNNYSVN